MLKCKALVLPLLHPIRAFMLKQCDVIPPRNRDLLAKFNVNGLAGGWGVVGRLVGAPPTQDPPSPKRPSKFAYIRDRRVFDTALFPHLSFKRVLPVEYGNNMMKLHGCLKQGDSTPLASKQPACLRAEAFEVNHSINDKGSALYDFKGLAVAMNCHVSALPAALPP
eukprot:167403-Pelagomonas_calceolata.AAC.1